jgi:hypothetical protein
MWTHPIDLMYMQFFESISAMSSSFHFYYFNKTFVRIIFFRTMFLVLKLFIVYYSHGGEWTASHDVVWDAFTSS